jgi:hypothetical protein
MPAVCRTFLQQTNVYLVTTSFRVSKGTYTLKDSAGVTLKATALSGQNLSANANLSVNGDGTMTITSDEYMAVQNVKQASLGNFTMGGSQGQIPSADSMLLGKSVKTLSQ